MKAKEPARALAGRNEATRRHSFNLHVQVLYDNTSRNNWDMKDESVLDTEHPAQRRHWSRHLLESTQQCHKTVLRLARPRTEPALEEEALAVLDLADPLEIPLLPRQKLLFAQEQHPRRKAGQFHTTSATIRNGRALVPAGTAEGIPAVLAWRAADRNYETHTLLGTPASCRPTSTHPVRVHD